MARVQTGILDCDSKACLPKRLYSITSNVNLDPLIKTVSAQFSHFTVKSLSDPLNIQTPLEVAPHSSLIKRGCCGMKNWS